MQDQNCLSIIQVSFAKNEKIIDQSAYTMQCVFNCSIYFIISGMLERKQVEIYFLF